MNYNTQSISIDSEYIEKMIERCYSVDQYLIVRNLGQCYAKLQYGNYSYRNNEGEYTQPKNLLQLKKIFRELINRHNSFEHEGHLYTRSRGHWTRYKLDI